jgi:hypothetical protein
MAQTVAMVRGTASGSANPSSVTTIFTNTASGAGTRVLCNMLTITYSGSYTNAQDSNQGRLMIIHTSSGGSKHIIGRYNSIYTGNGGGTMTNQYMPSYSAQLNIFPNMVNSPPMQIYAAGSGSSYLYPTMMTQGMVYQGFQSSQVPADISNLTSLTQWEPVYNNGSQTYKIFNFMPQNFWMGPSDTLSFRTNFYGYYSSGKSQYYGYQTANIGYSFTTITES